MHGLSPPILPFVLCRTRALSFSLSVCFTDSALTVSCRRSNSLNMVDDNLKKRGK